MCPVCVRRVNPIRVCGHLYNSTFIRSFFLDPMNHRKFCCRFWDQNLLWLVRVCAFKPHTKLDNYGSTPLVPWRQGEIGSRKSFKSDTLILGRFLTQFILNHYTALWWYNVSQHLMKWGFLWAWGCCNFFSVVAVPLVRQLIWLLRLLILAIHQATQIDGKCQQLD